VTSTWQDILSTLQSGANLGGEALEWFLVQNHGWRALLNGLMGDTLAARQSPLAIEMSLKGKIRGDKLCVLVHGLCDSETSWGFTDDPSQNYGRLLQGDLGYEPLFASYNSGLHISTNGQALARELDRLLKRKSSKIREIVFIGYSMGGLVVRSACHYGEQAGSDWVKLVKKIFLIGVPHLGSDWEKLGHVTSFILKKIPNPFTWGIAAIGNRRSAGIKDLRFGYLLDEDWKDLDENISWRNNRHSVPFLKTADHYHITGTVAKNADHFFARYFGDGLVPMRSAMGNSFIKSQRMEIPPERVKIFRGLSHRRLIHHPEIYGQIRDWFR